MRIDLDKIDYCRGAGRIIIGLSGGADSIALTHILFTHLGKEKLICAHVNHMLRGEEADRDEAFVRSFCCENGLRLQVLKTDVAKLAAEKAIGLEECGRQVRYGFFESLAPDRSDLIVTAHNADDNAETVIMNLARGSGLKGLCGIPESRGKIVRPILTLTRKDIEDYCAENNLKYVTDSTNLTDAYSRNAVRHKVIPVLTGINSGFVNNVTRLSELLRSDEDFIAAEAGKALESAKNEYGLDVCKVMQLHNALKRRVVYEFITLHGGRNIEKKHIDSVMQLLNMGGSMNLPPSILITVKQNCLTVTQDAHGKMPQVGVKSPKTVLPNGKILLLREMDMENREKINNLLFNNCFNYGTIKKVLTAGSRCEGDTMLLPRRKIRKSLKKLFNEMKIPAALRDDILVIKDGEEVVFVEGVGVSPLYAVSAETETAVYIEIK